MSESPPDETTVPYVLLVKPVFWISPSELTVLNVLLVFCLHLSFYRNHCAEALKVPCWNHCAFLLMSPTGTTVLSC